MRISDWSSDVCSSDLLADFGVRRLAVLERGFVGEQHMFVRDRNNVIVKRAALDRAVRLPDEQRARRIEQMLARDRLRRVEMLARGEASAANAIDENIDALHVMPTAQPHMVRRPLVADEGGDGGMNLKGRVGEGEAKLRERARPFVAEGRRGGRV